MALRDLIPWRKRGRDVEVRRGEESPPPGGRDVEVYRGEESKPLASLEQRMGRLFDEAFRGFDLMPFGSDHSLGVPNIEMSETDREIQVTVEVPSLEEKDLHVAFADGVLTIKGEKKSERQDKAGKFSEAYYGAFERQIAIDGVDDESVAAKFKNGVLTVTLRKTTVGAQRNTRFI
jgi:HSP20 family protein